MGTTLKCGIPTRPGIPAVQCNYFYIYEFMGEDEDAAAARKEEDKTELVNRPTAGLDEEVSGSSCGAIT